MRHRFALPCLALLVALSGCSAVTGGLLTFAADPATVPADAAAEHGFEEPTLQNRTLSTGPLAGAPVNVTLDIWVARTARPPDAESASDGEEAEATARNASALTVVSLPQAKVAGVPTNPLATAPLDALLERFTGAENVTRVGERSVPILGEERTVTTFRTGGRERAARVHVARVRHGDDVVLVVGVAGDERDDGSVLSLMERIEHETG